MAVAHARYSEMDQIAASEGFGSVDGVVLDLGVSSMQLDQPARGFSFMQDGPLDMRMGGRGRSAGDIVNTLAESELADIIFKSWARSAAPAPSPRPSWRAATTRPSPPPAELADLVARVLGRKHDDKKHPATRTFQALRLYLNGSWTSWPRGFPPPSGCFETGGRLVVVTFHSLEDRIAKRFFASRSAPPPRGSRHLPEAKGEILAPSFRLLNRRPLEPNQAEIRRNPRARSARLRAAERTEAPAHPLDLAALGVPRLSLCM